MKEVINFLKGLQDNPEDLTLLPDMVERAGEKEVELDGALEKVGQLHELNRKYLSMIPITDNTEETEETPEELPTIDEAVSKIMEIQ